jgi:thiamine biosynthesis lipoprotein
MTVTIPDGMALDLGAVAKGYALDRAAGVIVSQGIQSGLINAGGDIVAIGAKAKNRPWKIGVQNPDQSNSILAVIALNDKAVVTSGDYERFFEKDQKLYHHILDPCTGFPAGGLRSVTIIASNGIIADMAATAVFVMGKEKGLRFIESSKGLACLLMDSNGSITVSSGDQDLFQIKARNQR